MGVVCTLTGDMYRSSFGNYNPWKVPFVPNQSAALRCGQNDRACFQLLLYNDEDMTVTCDRTPALHKVWPLPAVRVECRLEGDFGCGIGLWLVEDVRDDDGNYKAEILSSATRKVQEKLRVQQVFLEIETEKNREPGLYRGQVNVYECRLFGDEKKVCSLPFTLEVLPVCLPPLSESGFELDLWQHHTSLARTYETPLWGEEHFALMERYLETLAKLGQRAATLIVSEAPWSGQWSAWYRTNPSDVFEYNMIRLSKDRAGSFHYDFTAAERYIRLCQKHGVDREIEIFGLAGVWTLEDTGLGRVMEDGEDALRVRYYEEESGCMRYLRKQEEIDAYLSAIDRMLYENGWADIARVACDEPADSALFRRNLKRLKGLMPHVGFKVTICSEAVFLEDYEEISDCVVNLPLLSGRTEQLSGLAQRYHLSFYTAMEPPHPNTFLGCHPAEIRFLPWLSLLLGMDGYLRWAAWLWPDRPFDPDSYHFQKFRAGGMQFLYPGKDGKPLCSLRCKQLARGIRDYLILKEYEKAKGQAGLAAKIAGGLLKAPLETMFGCRRAEEFLPLRQEAFDRITDGLLTELAEGREY